jgi:hypothetical protein
MLEDFIVYVIIAIAFVYSFKVIAPFKLKVFIAKRIQKFVPNSFVIWLAGQQGCDNCKK